MSAQDSPVPASILRRLHGWGRGRVFLPGDLLDLGSRGAIDVALHRLERAGTIRRLARGVYDYPRIHPQLGPLSPSTDEMAQAIARRTKSTVVRSGAAAANLLGLTTQVPGRAVYLTDGRSRVVRVGGREIRFAHASPMTLAGGDTTPGLVLRALRHLGQDAVEPQAIRRLRDALDTDDKAALVRLRFDAPAWLRPLLQDIAEAA